MDRAEYQATLRVARAKDRFLFRKLRPEEFDVAHGILVSARATSASDNYAAVVAVRHNTIGNTSGAGIWIENRDASSSAARLDATVVDNATSTTGGDGYHLSASSGTLLCARVRGNTDNGPGASATAYALLQADSSTFQLEGAAADAAMEIANTNGGTPVSTSGNITMVADGACSTPP